MNEQVDALIIGAGPAGLMAAEMLSGAGRVVVTEAMPTAARKFLMAGKSGLNLTKDEPLEEFVKNFSAGTGAHDRPPDYLTSGEIGFGPEKVQEWVRGLGIELFTGSTARVFPVGMKASPLLRAWLRRLRETGIELRTGWRWVGMEDGFRFKTPDGPRVISPRVTVLALGGASWPRLGSDAGWIQLLSKKSVETVPFQPANMGFHVQWSSAMQPHFGSAVKGVAIRAAGRISRGEWVISQHGIEGGGIYEMASVIRNGADAYIDLAPDLTLEAVLKRFERPKGKLSVGNWLRRVMRDPVKTALLLEWAWPRPEQPADWAKCAKNLPLTHIGPMGLERAISSAGGIPSTAITAELELQALPGVFVAGEMLDWEAPTGGYLITGCLATGRRAGNAARQRISR